MVTLAPLRKGEEKNEETLEVHISETPDAIYLKFGIWGTEIGGHFHSKNRPVSYKQHEITYTRKLHYCSSC